ncbi:hypothetical protein HDV06_006578 [Boothiomyces sp. JEL0866]|nr:hypothetical protein HDV06_006578 [Boothiomyces sp. JEL0866]
MVKIKYPSLMDRSFLFCSAATSLYVFAVIITLSSLRQVIGAVANGLDLNNILLLVLGIYGVVSSGILAGASYRRSKPLTATSGGLTILGLLLNIAVKTLIIFSPEFRQKELTAFNNIPDKSPNDNFDNIFKAIQISIGLNTAFESIVLLVLLMNIRKYYTVLGMPDEPDFVFAQTYPQSYPMDVKQPYNEKSFPPPQPAYQGEYVPEYTPICIFALAYTIFDTVRQAILKKVLKVSQIITIFGQFMWLLYSVGLMVVWCTPFSNQFSLAVFEEFLGVSYGLATLSSCAFTTMLVTDVLLKEYWYARYICWVILLGVHAGLFGANYDMWYLNGGPGLSNLDGKVLQFLYNWYSYTVDWLYLVFTYNTLIPMIIAHKIMYLSGTIGSSGNLLQFQKRIHQIDPFFVYLIAGQFLVVASYAILFYVKHKTYLLGNDIAYNDTLGIGVAITSLHSILTWRIYQIIQKASRATQHSKSMAKTANASTVDAEAQKKK